MSGRNGISMTKRDGVVFLIIVLILNLTQLLF